MLTLESSTISGLLFFKRLRIGFEYLNSFERDSSFIIGIAQQFNLTNEQVDQLFIEAAKL